MSRAPNKTFRNHVPEIFSDFQIDFAINPITGALAKVINEDSIRQRVKILVLTNLTERFYQPGVGSKVNAVMFDMVDDAATQTIDTTIRACIRNNEPAAKIRNLEVQANPDRNGYQVNIWFECINIPSSIIFLPIFVTRAR